MKYKIIFGIVIPLIIIIGLSLLANIGELVAREDYIDTLSLAGLFKDNEIKTSVKIGSIDLENNYFLSKRYELPVLVACLIDTDNVKEKIEAGNLRYSEGDYNYDYNKDTILYRDYNNVQTVEVGPASKKTVQIFLEPSYIFRNKNYDALIENYGDYEEVIIFKRELKSSYSSSYRATSCYNLDQKTVDESVHVLLVH